ncbi:MAG TPA: hypothetical protein VM537_18815, partial [Anaerolineae bacterium]|nr:hypothetical protein [Anaerolineae bacterium]
MKRISLLSLLLVTLFFLPPAIEAEEPVVRAVLFWSATCPHCHVVMNETLPKIQERYGDQLEVLAVEASAPDGYLLWLEALDAFEVPSERQAVPMLIIGDRVLVGELEIADTLPSLIEAGAAAGGLDYSELPGLGPFLPAESTPPTASPTVMSHEPTPSASPRPTATVKACPDCLNESLAALSTTPTPDAVAHLWLFYDSDCGSCVVLQEEILPRILERYAPAQVVIHGRDVAKSGYDLMRALEDQHGLEYGDMP